MTTADDILFAPLNPAIWRLQCQEIYDYLAYKGNLWDTSKYPPGALLLENMLEAYFVDGQRQFHEVGLGINYRTFEFNGKFYLNKEDEHAGYCIERGFDRSILDSNLYPNDYNGHYVFRDDILARNYWQWISP